MARKTKREPKTKSKKWLLIVCFLIVLAFAGIFGFLQFTGKFVVVGKPTISFVSETGQLVGAEKVILDGKDLGSVSEGKITIEGLNTGEHQIIIIINGIRYPKTFSYTGGDVKLPIGEPVTVKISVWSKTANKPVPNVKVYLDEEGVKCTTNEEGICSFVASPEKHVFKLEGNGVFYEETVTVSKDSSSFTFKVERKLMIKVKVTDDLHNPLANAQVLLDGSPKGFTNQNGELEIPNVEEGQHNVETIYKELSERSFVNAGESVTLIIKTPKDIEITILDELTNEPIEGAEITLDGMVTKTTDGTGLARFSNVNQGSHSIVVKYREVSKTESITVSTQSTSFDIKIKAPRTVQLLVTDTETGNSVKNVRVFLNGKEYGTTTQDGTLLVTILPGSYRVTVDTTKGILDAGYISVSTQPAIEVKVDMPNPVIHVTGDWDHPWYRGNGKCTIEISNTGTDDTVNSIALCLVYDASNGNLLGSDTVLIGPVATGGVSRRVETDPISVGWNPLRIPKESIVIVVFDPHPYLKSQEESIRISASPNLVSQILSDIYNYCSSHPQECVKIAGSFVGSLLRG